ncbi:hypothetical protein GWK47_034569 [Chionoecetes opilio]|uniref:HTH CENPB-type domain-containing protein n=1 Tax=Chionoecetes opilio TaxID=41210 RepID=A0A8J5D0N8_CHIOP|nr:hypothetical protein GWK47_034569 [Chionoecetes opilio]
MEKILNRWISEQVDQRKRNVDGVAIREKARSIYDHLAEKEPSGPPLPPGLLPAMVGSIDSSSVLACTTLLAQVRVGQLIRKAQAYLSTFKSLIEDSDYLPEQGFNADENWPILQEMGNRTYIHKERAVYREALKRMEDDSTMTLMDFWKQYNIRHALLGHQAGMG